MKIVIPILGFGRAGGYRVLSQLANGWIKTGHDVDFLCPNDSAEPYFPTNARILWVDDRGGVSIRRINIKSRGGCYHLKALYLGLRAIGVRYDIIFANHSLTAWPVAVASCGNARNIYYVQAYEPEYYYESKTVKGFLISILSALSYHFPLQKIVNSPIYFRYRNLSASKCVPPGLDMAIFSPELVDRDLECADKIIIGCVGRHEPEKGTIYVLRAFEKLYEKDSRFFLRVAYGNLPVTWMHEQSEVVVPRNDQELADYYRSVDILVAPGTLQHGAAHYPVLEAGACGVAVVTTGYMGATEETAWIVRNEDVESIVQAIQKIVTDDCKRIEKKRKMLDEMRKYSWETVSEKFINIFNDKSITSGNLD